MAFIGVMLKLIGSQSFPELMQQEINKSSTALECKRQIEYIPPSDLPLIHPLFVGRDKDVDLITTKLLDKNANSVRIINVHGPPAFGKSTLAIHVGQKLVEFNVAVRYIDSLEHRHFAATSVPNAKTDTYIGVVRSFASDLVKWVQTNSDHESDETQYDFASDLHNWAKTQQNFTVLILDNCDDMLNSDKRDSFL